MDFGLTAVAAAVVSAAIVGGALFVFSSFVIAALVRLNPADGIRAMQSINLTAVRPSFMVLIFGTGVLALAALVFRFGEPWVILGASSYIVGVLGVTMFANVPSNAALALVDVRARDHERVWKRYVSGWIRWNHVRVAASVLSSAAFLAALET